jgi:hypothetical protein
MENATKITRTYNPTQTTQNSYQGNVMGKARWSIMFIINKLMDGLLIIKQKPNEIRSSKTIISFGGSGFFLSRMKSYSSAILTN